LSRLRSSLRNLLGFRPSALGSTIDNRRRIEGQFSVIVFVGGMPRSGSTFSFNVVRCLLEDSGRVHQVPSESLLVGLEQVGEAQHLILKGHGADPITLALTKLAAIKAVCTVRKPEDAIGSWMAAFGFSLEESLGTMQAWLQMFSVIRDYAVVIPFQQIEEAPEDAAWKIARHLCDRPDPALISRIAADFSKTKVKELSADVAAGIGDIEDIGFSAYDKRTFFHGKHVSSAESTSAVDRIGSAQVSTIRSSLSNWCDGDGNLL
jgi:hypothetical protein